MADPNLEDLAELAALGGGAVDNPYAELLAAGAPLFLAKVSDSMRDLIGELGRAKRRIVQLETQNAAHVAAAARTAGILDELEDMHRPPQYAPPERCAGCRRKWPCKTAKILGSDHD